MFVVDTTSSMGDELVYLKSELVDVIDRANQEIAVLGDVLGARVGNHVVVDQLAPIEQEIVEEVRQVRAEVRLPLAVKLSPFFTNLSAMAKRLAAAGADGLVLFNRFYQPDLDLETLDVLVSTSDLSLYKRHLVGLDNKSVDLPSKYSMNPAHTRVTRWSW